MKNVEKLTLHKETVRKLDADELGRVAGGSPLVSVVLCAPPTQPNEPGCDCQGTSGPLPTYNCQ